MATITPDQRLGRAHLADRGRPPVPYDGGGDDDQNIYAFDGANVRYIRQFEADYQPGLAPLAENYRSTAHIIHCANRVIARPGRAHEGRAGDPRRSRPPTSPTAASRPPRPWRQGRAGA